MCKDQRSVGLPASRQIHHKFRIHAVASAYPPIAQTEKTFRLPIDYYQVSGVGWGLPLVAIMAFKMYDVGAAGDMYDVAAFLFD